MNWKRIGNLLTALCMALVITFSSSACAKKPYGGLFETDRIHTVDIRIAEEDWNDLLAHPTERKKYHVDAVIDGETIKDVSLAAKGNSSLTFVADSGISERYSFKLIFDKYQKGQTYHGLDRLNLQNMFADATYMKDYLSYDLFRRAGVNAPLASYILVRINGEPHGLYLAAEEIGKSYLQRVYHGKGSLYKPEAEDIEIDAAKLEDIKNGGAAGGENAGGADFVYLGDSPEFYPGIFRNDEAGDSPETQQRIISGLKDLAEGNPQKALDTKEIISYFAVQNFLMNYDGYTGVMLHNYYLYETDGKLALLPWDYNSAFGGFPMDGVIGHHNDPSLVVNLGIDSPLVGIPDEARPMWSWIPADETYRAQYHDVFAELIKEEFESGAFEARVDALYPQAKRTPSIGAIGLYRRGGDEFAP